MRHWVLSLPYQLRYLLAWDHDLCRVVASLFVRAVFRVLRERARDEGIEGGRGGAVVGIQRFGGALNLNVHVHALVLDGVFAPGVNDVPVFQRTLRLTTLDVSEVLATVEPLIARRQHLAGSVTRRAVRFSRAIRAYMASIRAARLRADDGDRHAHRRPAPVGTRAPYNGGDPPWS